MNVHHFLRMILGVKCLPASKSLNSIALLREGSFTRLKEKSDIVAVAVVIIVAKKRCAEEVVLLEQVTLNCLKDFVEIMYKCISASMGVQWKRY